MHFEFGAESMQVIPFLSETRIADVARVRRERLLPAPGQVSVTVGTRVDPLDVVARSAGTARLSPIPIARYLHATESKLAKYLLKQPGDEIREREIIASKPEMLGTLQRIYRAPRSGRVGALQGIWMTIELNDAPVELTALYRGTVVDVMPGRGVVIEAVGTLAQGIWGCGGDGYGVLKKLVDSPEQVLTEDVIDVTVRGAVILGGAGITFAALRRAAQEHAAGIVVGGLPSPLYEVAPTLGVPVLVTEGFGARPMAQLIFDLLAAHDAQETCLNTNTRSSGGSSRPEIFIPTTSGQSGAASARLLDTLAPEVGAIVRVTAPPHEGETGKIVAIPKLPQTLESGILVWGVEVELGEEQVFVPAQNVELIG